MENKKGINMEIKLLVDMNGFTDEELITLIIEASGELKRRTSKFHLEKKIIKKQPGKKRHRRNNLTREQIDFIKNSDLKPREIAEKLGVNIKNIYYRLHILKKNKSEKSNSKKKCWKVNPLAKNNMEL